MTHATVTLCFRDIEFDVDCEGEVTRGGSNSYGSDEPAWIEVSGVSYYHPRTGRPISRRLRDWIEKEYDDYVGDALIEAYESW